MENQTEGQDGRNKAEVQSAEQRAESHREMFNEVISQLRSLSANISDFRLKMRVLVVIANVTHQNSDIAVACEKAMENEHRGPRSEAMTIIVKALAEDRRFEEARKIAGSMVGMDNYWRASAKIWIARFSGDQNDIVQAEEAVSDVASPEARNEARGDLELLVHKRHHHSVSHADHKHYALLMSLRTALSQLSGLEDNHLIAPQATSVSLRLTVQGIIERIFADALE